jgi:hypothetical protein
MSYFFHEHSCRRLLALLRDKIEAANDHLQEHKISGKPQDADEKRYTDALLKAAKAVDEECQKLQFWSDARTVPRISKVSFEGDEPDGSRAKYETASEHSPKAQASEADNNDSRSVGSSNDSIRQSKKDKGKAPIRQDESEDEDDIETPNVGGFDGTFDIPSPPPVEVPPILISAATSDSFHEPQRTAEHVTRSRASRSSLRRQSSQVESFKLAELSPEPVPDQLEEQEAPVHVKSKRRLSRTRSTSSKGSKN